MDKPAELKVPEVLRRKGYFFGQYAGCKGWHLFKHDTQHVHMGTNLGHVCNVHIDARRYHCYAVVRTDKLKVLCPRCAKKMRELVAQKDDD